MRYVLGDRAADWLRRQLSAGYTSGPAPARQRPRDESAPLPDLLPYTVRWCSAEASGAGAWVVWLGDLSRVLYHAGVAQQPGNVTAAATLPAGWYLVDDLTTSHTALWLNVRTVSGTGAFADAELSSTPASATTGYDVAAYCVAALSVDATTGARSVAQYICSAVVLAAPGAGGGGTQQTATAITAIALREVSTGNYQLQVKTTPLTFVGTMGNESAWTTVFDTVPHSNNPIV